MTKIFCRKFEWRFVTHFLWYAHQISGAKMKAPSSSSSSSIFSSSETHACVWYVFMCLSLVSALFFYLTVHLCHPFLCQFCFLCVWHKFSVSFALVFTAFKMLRRGMFQTKGIADKHILLNELNGAQTHIHSEFCVCVCVTLNSLCILHTLKYAHLYD